MLFFFISFIVACVVSRRWFLRTGEAMIVLVGVMSGLSAYGMIDPRVLALPDQSKVNLLVWGSVAIGIVEVVAAFWLAWGLRWLLFRRRKKSPNQ